MIFTIWKLTSAEFLNALSIIDTGDDCGCGLPVPRLSRVRPVWGPVAVEGGTEDDYPTRPVLSSAWAVQPPLATPAAHSPSERGHGGCGPHQAVARRCNGVLWEMTHCCG